MNSKQETLILFPGGEWQNSLFKAMDNAGIEINRLSTRTYRTDIPSLNIQAVTVRSKEVVDKVNDLKCLAVAGITGTDILVESGCRPLPQVINGQNPDWTVPLLPDSPQPKMYVGVTPNAKEQFGEEPTLAQIVEGVHDYCLSCTS